MNRRKLENGVLGSVFSSIKSLLNKYTMFIVITLGICCSINIATAQNRGNAEPGKKESPVKVYVSFIDAETDARLGVPLAQYALGRMYLEGFEISQNIDEGMKWIRKAIDVGQPDAMELLGDIYWQGKGVKKDSAEAIKWYSSASSKLQVTAMLKLSLINIFGLDGSVKHINESMELLNKAASLEKTNPEIRLVLGWISKNGTRNVPASRRTYEEAVINLKRLSYDLGLWFASEWMINKPETKSDGLELLVYVSVKEQTRVDNNADYIKTLNQFANSKNENMDKLVDFLSKNARIEAYADLGSILFYGIQGASNEIYGLELLRRAAEYGNEEARSKLAKIYVDASEYFTRGTFGSLVDWLEEEESTLSHAILAMMYADGRLVDKNVSKLSSHMDKAINGKDDWSLYVLGRMTMEGIGVVVDLEQARELFEASLDTSIDKRDELLADMYLFGEGGPKKQREGYLMLDSLISEGESHVLYRWAQCYENGWGVREDLEKAIEVYRKLINERDYVPAIMSYARICKEGPDEYNDPKTALQLLHKAALLGHWEAQVMLVDYYITGEVIQQDFIKAYSWLLVANHTDKTNMMLAKKNAIEDDMISKEIERGKILARDYLNRISVAKKEREARTLHY